MTVTTAVTVRGVAKTGEVKETLQVYCPPSEVLSVLNSIWLTVIFPSEVIPPLLIMFPPGSSHVICGIANIPLSFVAVQLIKYGFPAVSLPTALVDILKASGSSTRMKIYSVIMINAPLSTALFENFIYNSFCIYFPSYYVMYR